MAREIICAKVRSQILQGAPKGVELDVVSTKRRGLRVVIPAQTFAGKEIPAHEISGKDPSRLGRHAVERINELIS
jgi:hypothetical protein